MATARHILCDLGLDEVSSYVNSGNLPFGATGKASGHETAISSALEKEFGFELTTFVRAAWHLGLSEGATDETKACHAFVFGDLRRVHRTGLIACVYRASERCHKDVELAAHDLLQYLDRLSA